MRIGVIMTECYVIVVMILQYILRYFLFIKFTCFILRLYNSGMCHKNILFTLDYICLSYIFFHIFFSGTMRYSMNNEIAEINLFVFTVINWNDIFKHFN